ncbi:MAG TPA: tetratricopeptide repeat protein [Actinocrinis sp.]|nr:tetratricopeptide repeat protein [Actinocrinis sp.]
METFGNLVRRRRRALDLTQEDLAHQVGYSVITIRKVESDERRPSRQLADLLARSLEIAPEQRPAFTALARAESGEPDPLLLDQIRDGRPPGRRAEQSGNLPHPLTRLVGREGELTTLRAVLMQKEVRLVTLVGPPGIGKSRLGVEVATRTRAVFPDGVYYVALEAIGDAAVVPLAIARTVGVKGPVGHSPVAGLAEHLYDRRVLLLLDNFEHLLEAVPVIAELLTNCPGPKIVATSRAPLRVRGERLYQVPPLATPKPTHPMTADAAAGYTAVELFLDRARDADPGFALDDANAADVTAICADLDGIPLAIELVAARSRSMSPQELAAWRGRRLALLTDGPRDLPAHQQTLRSALDWSYNLLSPDEQALFARLAVFIGGCSLDAAAQVALAPGDLSLRVLDGLTALADKNLLGREVRGDGERYFGYLGTIREYALERLAERGEEPGLYARYRAFYLALAEDVDAHSGGDELRLGMDRLDAAQDNLRAVLAWYVQHGDAASGLRMVCALWTFWHIRSYQLEGLRWTALVLALPGAGKDRVRAKALLGAGWIALDCNDHGQAGACFAESLGICRALGDPLGIANALHGVGIIALASEDDTAAAGLFAESLALYQALDDSEGIAWSLDHLGNAALGLGDYGRALSLFEESSAIFRELRHAWGISISLHHEGMAALAVGDLRRAGDCFDDSRARFVELANHWGAATSLEHLGYVALSTRESARARDYFVRGLDMSYDEDDRVGLARGLAGLASVAVAEQDMVRAACLFGGAEVLAEASGIRMDPVVLAIHRRDVHLVRHRLDRLSVARAWADGRQMSVDELMRLARAASSAVPPEGPSERSSDTSA